MTLALSGIARAAGEDALIGNVVQGTAPTLYSGFEGVATCPAGERAIGGGIVQIGAATDLPLRASGPLDETGTMAATQSGDKPRYWYAAASNETTSPVTFRVFAVCAKAGVTLEVKKFKMPTGEGKGKSVECPGSKRVVGGGVIQSGGYGGSFVRESGPTGASGSFGDVSDGVVARQWRATMHNQGGSEFFKVMAVCAAGTKAKLEVKNKKLPAATVTASSFANCPAGSRAVGGGVVHNRGLDGYYSLTPTGPTEANGSAADTDVGDVPTRWFGGLNNSLGAPAAKFKIATICA